MYIPFSISHPASAQVTKINQWAKAGIGCNCIHSIFIYSEIFILQWCFLFSHTSYIRGVLELFFLEFANRKRKKKSKGDNKQRSENPAVSADTVKKGVLCASLPEEIWNYIFQIVIKDSGPLPFLCRFVHVIQLWI